MFPLLQRFTAARSADPENSYARGVQTLVNLGSARATEGVLFDSEGMDYALKANLFGYLFGRGVLSYTDREIVVLATIASLGDGVEAQLGSHMKNTHSLGVSSAELQKIVDAIKIVNSDNGAASAGRLEIAIALSPTHKKTPCRSKPC